ncbi:hypothetical protein NFI96_020439, partial [Prochilodus magdalenae]
LTVPPLLSGMVRTSLNSNRYSVVFYHCNELGLPLEPGLSLTLCCPVIWSDFRLVDGEDRCSGRPEVLYEGEWKSVCSFFEFAAAMMVCRQLDCGNAVRVNNGSLYKAKTSSDIGIVIQCERTGSVASECSYSVAPVCFLNLGIICSGSVRLVDGAGSCSGRVEVNTSLCWAPVCKNDFDWHDAQVACRGLGCGTPVSLQGMPLGELEHSCGIKEFQCNGTEKRLLDCRTSDKENNCMHGNAVELTCSGPDDVRLTNGRCVGTVEMFHGGEWRQLTPLYMTMENGDAFSFHWTMKLAAVVCRQLGCGSAVSARWRKASIARYKTGIVSVCEGSETALRECRIFYEEPNFTSDVTCSGISGQVKQGLNAFPCLRSAPSDAVRLVDGAGFCSGRVEVKTAQSWTTVCDTDFDWKDAEVVCREVGCGPPLTLQAVVFGKDDYSVGAKEFQCNGTENVLLDCSTSAKEEHTCAHGSTVELTCSGSIYTNINNSRISTLAMKQRSLFSEPEDVRLVGKGSRCAGTAEMFLDGGWVKLRSYPRTHGAEAHSWSMREAAVVCRQLGCGSAVAATWSNKSVPGIHVNCEGTESALRECSLFSGVYNGGHGGAICSGLLVQPSISFSTPIRASRDRQGPEVFRGHSFTVTCYTEPQYLGGTFHLMLPWTNRTLVQAAVNHSASFVFHSAEDSHQGSYSCVYENQVLFEGVRFWAEDGNMSEFFVHNFSSTSQPFSLAVTGIPLNSKATAQFSKMFFTNVCRVKWLQWK